LAALELIRAEEPSTAFVCYGDAEGVALPSWVQALGRVSAPELRAFYNRCGVFLLTSTVEGWGLPALEAMACGAAVVSTQSGGVQDFIDDRVSGMLVPVGDARAIADRALELLRRPAERVAMTTAAAREAQRRTVDRSVDELEQLLIELARAGRAS
jgi:glycosyltransferase involved in cell wall biosynthesis